MKSPAYIRALIDVHTLAKPEVNENLLADLEHDKLIEKYVGGWSSSARGRAYVEALVRVPLPVQKWVAPE